MVLEQHELDLVELEEVDILLAGSPSTSDISKTILLVTLTSLAFTSTAAASLIPTVAHEIPVVLLGLVFQFLIMSLYWYYLEERHQESTIGKSQTHLSWMSITLGFIAVSTELIRLIEGRFIEPFVWQTIEVRQFFLR